MVLVVVWLIWVIRRFRNAAAGPPRQDPARPRTPAGIHMPGPSWAPVFAAIGAALLFLGLVFGGRCCGWASWPSC